MSKPITFTPKGWPNFITVEYRHNKSDPETGQEEGATVTDIYADTTQGSISIEDWLETLTGGLDRESLDKEAFEDYQGGRE